MRNGEQFAGYKWLSQSYGVPPVQPLRVSSTIGSARSNGSCDLDCNCFIDENP